MHLPVTGIAQVYLLYRETSDQRGTDEVVGVFTSEDRAVAESKLIRESRTRVTSWILDEPFATRDKRLREEWRDAHPFTGGLVEPSERDMSAAFKKILS